MKIFCFALAILSCSLFIGDAQAGGPYKPLKDILSNEEFTGLVMFDVRRVPGLSHLWDVDAKIDTSTVFLGGGILRGLLHWHYIKLQSHTVSEIKKMPIPPLSKLQLPGGKDVDIYAPRKLTRSVERILKGVPGLDVLDVDNISEYTKLGGATIEKIALNPFSIIDLSGGFQDYYNGQIVYRVPDGKEIKSSRFSDADYTEIGEVIRFVRFAEFNLTELENGSQNIKLIREREPINVTAFRNDEGKLAWMEISLEKLFYASNENISAVLSMLHKYNLLSDLAQIGISVPHSQEGFLRQWIKENAEILTTTETESLRKNYDVLLPRKNIIKCEKDIEKLKSPSY